MTVQALDESSKPVDWWFIYKVPRLRKAADADSATGYEYVYFDATMDKNRQQPQKSPYTLDQNKGALRNTLGSVFTSPADTVGWILYNDEKPTTEPGSDDGNLGHTKGVIVFDTKTGTAFWLLHSWPKYAAPGAVAMPTPMYGQTFFCVSIDIKTANDIAAIMPTHQEPQVYSPRGGGLKASDSLFALTKPLPPDTTPHADVLDCVSSGGLNFKVLAKNRAWNQDFWNGFVGPQLGADMDVETWIRGDIPPVVDTDGIHKTFDIKFINLGPLGIHWAWPESQDHAKWGITKVDPWICVGDINRMISQRKRGGGTIAFKNWTLWTALGKTDLILAPPGHTRDEARAMIAATHVDPDAPPAKLQTKRKPSTNGTTNGTATPKKATKTIGATVTKKVTKASAPKRKTPKAK